MKNIFKHFFSFILIYFCNISFLHSEPDTKDIYDSAIKSYLDKQYVEAELKFSQSVGYKPRIGQAMSNFMLKKTKKSLLLFKRSILLAENDSERFIALYNAATCSFIIGKYTDAAELYKQADKYNKNDKNTLNFIELSDYLSKLVLAQLARDKAPGNKKKSSEGKKTISSIDFKFNDDINLRIEDSDKSYSKTKNKLQEIVSDQALLKKLVSAGINAIKIKDDGYDNHLPSIIDQNISYEFTLLDSSKYTPAASNSDLWQRIFELEKGYPASLDEAETLPGVNPW